MVAVDCRCVGEGFVRDAVGRGDVRTRRGWKGGGEDRGLGYFDWADWEREGLGPGLASSSSSSPLSSPLSFPSFSSFPFPSPSSLSSPSSSSSNPNSKRLRLQHDELDPTRIVFKSFWSWNIVDSVRSMREKEGREREKIFEWERKRKEKEKEKSRSWGVGDGGVGVGIAERWLSIGRRGKGFNGGASGEGGDTNEGGEMPNGTGTGGGTRTGGQYGLIQLDGNPNMDWDDRGCVVM